MEGAKVCKNVNSEDRRTLSPGKNDSLTDFKSPKTENVTKASSGKLKIVVDKRTKKSSSKGKTSVGNKKKEGSTSGRQLQNGKAQPSIESSFFKAANTGKREGHTCPLCMRYFDDLYAGTAHTKSCAAKNKVSTTKLLAAVALQERQADERLAIGLPAAPLLQSKAKTPRRYRGATSKADSDLQLALALSKSLEENQAERELEEALLVAAEHRGDEPIAEMTDSQRRRTLKNFGFLTNKPVSDVPTKPRRKKHLGPTILQTRTQESRDRLLTERIAEILMGNEAITQACQQESNGEVNSIEKQPVVLKSRLLNEIHRTTKRLWDSSQLSRGITNFYVEDLGAVVVPAVDFATLSETDPDSKADSPRLSNECQIEADNNVTEKMLHSSNNKMKETEDRVESPKNIYVTDRQYRNNLPMDWSNTLNVSTMSDVVVLVDKNHIWAHKLVFHVRCSDILLDCQAIDDKRFPHVKEKISWLDIDYLTALAFLEFVYSGVIVKNEHVFNDDRISGLVRTLARKYRLKDLFEYMRKRKSEVDRRSEELEGRGRESGLRSPIVIEVARRNREADSVPDNPAVAVESKDEPGPSTSSASRKTAIVDLTITKTPDLDVQCIEDDVQTIDTESINDISVASTNRYTMSPDIFDDTTEEAMENAETNNHEDIEASAQVSANESSNLKVLAQLIAEDNLSQSTQANESDTSSTASTFIDDKQPEEFPEVKYTKEYSSLSQRQVETPRSRSSSISTDTKKINDRSRTQRLPEKQKSNLSIFIEKVQKINAKSVLDSYTEEESLGEPYDRGIFRNPFNINNESNKSILDGSHEADSGDGQPMDGKGALSALEEQLLLQHEKKEKRIDLTSADESEGINESLSMGLSDLEDSSIVDNPMSTDDENTSMYSKYKKAHKHNNSINKYRSRLIQLTESSATVSEDDDNSDYLTPLNDDAIDLTQESNSEVESSPSFDVRSKRRSTRALVSDSNDSLLSKEHDGTNEKSSTVVNRNDPIVSSDDAADESFDSGESLTPVPKRAINQDESKNVTSRVASSFDYRKNLSTSPEYPVPHLCEGDELLTQSLKNRRTLTPSPRRSADATDKSVSGRRKRRFDESRTTDRSFIDDLEKDEEVSRYSDNRSSRGTKSLSHSSQYPDLDVFEVNEDIFTQRFRSPQVSPSRTLTPSPRPKSGSSGRKRRIDESRAKETSFADGSEKDEEKEEEAASSNGRKKRRSSHYSDLDVLDVNDQIFTQSFKSPSVSPRRTLTPLPSYGATNEDEHRGNETLRVPSPILISSSPDVDPDSDRRVTNTRDSYKENSFFAAEGKVSPLYSRRNTLSPSNLEEPPSPKPGPSRRGFSPECSKISPSSAKNPLVRWNSMPTSTTNTQGRLKITRTPTKSSSLVLSPGVTPPVNYDAMDTPELKRELGKYGIKPQKAHRARQLLTHIYNELHPEVLTTASELALDDDEEPPVKKIGRNNSQSSNDSEPESVTSAVSVIPEEMEFADADIPSNESDDASSKCSMKQGFTALVKEDKELHNKLLTYEPLSLELLHMMLKARGFKFKVNDLMDFLDEECITFQVKDQGRRQNSKKPQGKKTAASGRRRPNSRKRLSSR